MYKSIFLIQTKRLDFKNARFFASNSFAKYTQAQNYTSESYLEDSDRKELVMTLKQNGELGKAIEIFKNHGITPSTIDPKPSLIYRDLEVTDYYLNFEESEKGSSLQKAVTELKKMPECLTITDIPKVPWFPQCISDFDQYNKILRMGDGIEQSDHIAFKDEDYVKRRNYIAEVGNSYSMDDPMIPTIDYNDNEKQTWKT